MSLSVSADRRTSTELRAAGCTCEFGCMNCGYHESGMGNCPAWNPCPVGRAKAKDCPVHGTED